MITTSGIKETLFPQARKQSVGLCRLTSILIINLMSSTLGDTSCRLDTVSDRCAGPDTHPCQTTVTNNGTCMRLLQTRRRCAYGTAWHFVNCHDITPLNNVSQIAIVQLRATARSFAPSGYSPPVLLCRGICLSHRSLGDLRPPSLPLAWPLARRPLLNAVYLA